jgi:hypothetical protein
LNRRRQGRFRPESILAKVKGLQIQATVPAYCVMSTISVTVCGFIMTTIERIQKRVPNSRSENRTAEN